MCAGEGKGHRNKTEELVEGRRLSEVTQLVTGETRRAFCRMNDKNFAPLASLELLHSLKEGGATESEGVGGTSVWLCHSLAVWSWEGQSMSGCLCLLIHERGIMIIMFLGSHED